MSDTAVRMAAYAKFLEGYFGDYSTRIREQHVAGAQGCVFADHCRTHHVDEPDNGDVYRSCLVCGHVFVTEIDLQAADVRERTSAWQSQLRNATGPLDHSDAPVARPGQEIRSCPFCTYDF